MWRIIWLEIRFADSSEETNAWKDNTFHRSKPRTCWNATGCKLLLCSAWERGCVWLSFSTFPASEPDPEALLQPQARSIPWLIRQRSLRVNCLWRVSRVMFISSGMCVNVETQRAGDKRKNARRLVPEAKRRYDPKLLATRQLWRPFV